MNPRLRAGLALLLLVGVFVACKREPEAVQAFRRDNYFKTHFQDESQFVVETVLMDLVEMASYARSNGIPSEVSVIATERSDSEFRKPSYDVKITIGKKTTVEKSILVKQPIWSPELYTDFAKILLGSNLSSGHAHDTNDLSVLLALMDLRPETIEAENRKVSSQLATNFSNPTLHEMAAVVLGAFALREFSGSFYDVRSPLCRMTAHLALARALSGQAGMGVNGRVAEALLFTLMNNQKTALEKIKALESEPKLEPWANALRIRNTYDYRQLGSNPTLLEKVMCYFAISRCIDGDAGRSKLSPALIKRTSDFSRIAYSEGYSVGLGHQLRETSLPLEFAEIQKVQSLASGREPAKGEWVTFLNQAPERCVLTTTTNSEVRIIGPGQWGTFLQRHLCHVLQHNFDFLQRQWGVPEEAKAFAEEAEKNCGELRLYPFVRRFNSITEKEYRQAVDEGMPVTAATPQLVSPEIWNYLCNPPSFTHRYNPVPNPHVNEWHKHNPPPGTAYNPKPRLYHPSLVDRPDSVQVFEQLHDLAPFDVNIADGIFRTNPDLQETYARAEEVYRPLLEYAARPNQQLARHTTNDPVRYEQVMVRYAKLMPFGYFTLGQYFADREQEGKAAEYYEKGVELDDDPVGMSNNCDWLVKYYYRKGQREKAESLADSAAEVYSYQGLRTKADLMEMEEKYDEALKYYLRIEERYNYPGPVAGFCVRYKSATGDSRFDGHVQTRLKTLFPRGIERVELSNFKSPPEEGLLVREDTELMRQAGLKKGDIIVALDEVRVYDMTQYQYVRELTNAVPIKLIAWNGREYSEISASPPKRRFGVPFDHFFKPARK